MPYLLEFTDSANRDLSRLDPAIAQQVRQKLNELSDRAESARHRALAGRLRGQFRLRVGSHRVLYELDRANRRMIVRSIRHRREVYD